MWMTTCEGHSERTTSSSGNNLELRRRECPSKCKVREEERWRAKTMQLNAGIVAGKATLRGSVRASHRETSVPGGSGHLHERRHIKAPK